MDINNIKFIQDFIRMSYDGYLQGWHERNGGNLSYRMKKEEVEEIKSLFTDNQGWLEIGTEVPGLANEYFLVTGSGKFFRNVILSPNENMGIIEIDNTGTK